MKMSSLVGQRGQVVIEKPLRDALGLQPGYIAVQRLVGDHVELYFYPPEHDKSLLGILANETERSVSPEEWDAAREEAWSKAVRSTWLADEAPK
jgi:bifunctional DNA-binding transcriptional regulator/antitoxin component of YhaV-PrlF toxin-antitoxin module